MSSTDEPTDSPAPGPAGMPPDPDPAGIDPETTGPGDTGPETTGPGDVEPEDTEPETTGPGDTASGDTEPRDTEPGGTGSEDVEPEDTESEDTGPEDTGPEDTGSEDTGSGGAEAGDGEPEGDAGSVGAEAGAGGPPPDAPGSTRPGDGEPAATVPGGTGSVRVEPFDFRRPPRVRREHLRTLEVIHEGLERALTTQLTLLISGHAQAASDPTYEEPWDGVIRRWAARPAVLWVLEYDQLDGPVGVVLDGPLVWAYVDRVLGGTGEPPPGGVQRPITDIEASLTRRMIEAVSGTLVGAFSPVSPLTGGPTEYVTTFTFTQLASGGDVCLGWPFRFTLGAGGGVAEVVIPFPSLGPLLDRLTASRAISGGGEDPAQWRDRVADRLDDVRVEVTANLRSVTMPVHRLRRLRVGDLILTGHLVDEAVHVLCDGIPVATAARSVRGHRVAVTVVDTTIRRRGADGDDTEPQEG